MRVLFVTQYGALAASSRTRVFQYLPFLRQQGVGCEVLTVLPDTVLAGSQVVVTRNPLRKALYYLRAGWRTVATGLRAWWRAADVDVLFLQKVIFPAPLRWLLRRRGVPLVYDFDDAIFTTEVRTGGLLARWKEARNAAGLPAMLALARWAVVENDYTGAVASRHCQVLTITGPIDTAPYAGIRRQARPAGSPVVLGWIGSATTVAYLDLIRVPLQRLAQRHPLRLCIVGADWRPSGLEVECRAWELEREAEDLAGCDIGLMPVPDDPWTRGKGGYKLLQYMAAALPVVTHPVGINGDIVADGETGYLAADDGAWERRLAELIGDPDRRQRFGESGRARVEERYALRVHEPRLLQMLQEVAGAP